MHNKFSFNTPNVVVFKKWQRKSYAVFNTLQKQIRIAALAFTYSLIHLSTPNYAQTDSLTIWKSLDMDEVIVSAQRAPVIYSRLSRIVNTLAEEELDLMPVTSLEDALSYIPSVDIRTRGPLGVQADLSIRGGSFDQNLVLLNGIDVTDPQTGHFALNVPINIDDVKEIEVLKGPGSRVFGPNAFKGAVNLITTPQRENQAELKILGGQHGLFETTANTHFSFNNTRHFLSISHRTSNGYQENTDFDISNAFYHGLFNLSSTKLDLQAGIKNKAFGAQSFFTPEYPHQFEENTIYFASLSAAIDLPVQIKPAIYWRRHEDRFELFRESDDWYQREGDFFVKGENDTAKYVNGIYEPWNYYRNHNHHRTDIYGSKLNLSYNSFLGQSSLGIEFRAGNILSNVLGTPMNDTLNVAGKPHGVFTKSYSRNQLNAYLEHVFYWNDLTLSGGILGSYSNEYSNNWQFYPGIDVSYILTNYLKFYASYNQSLRLPTFTDLFYEGPSNIGNSNLKPETITSYEGGFRLQSKFITGYLSYFYSGAEQLIAWVRMPDSDDNAWKTENLTQVVNQGIELQFEVPLEFTTLKKLRLSYTYINQDKSTSGSESKYSLSYLKHKAVIQLFGNISDHWYYSIINTYKDRNGEFPFYDKEKNSYTGSQKYKSHWLVDAKLSWQKEQWKIFVSCSNILNRNYYSVGNIEMPGLWVKAGVVKKLAL